MGWLDIWAYFGFAVADENWGDFIPRVGKDFAGLGSDISGFDGPKRLQIFRDMVKIVNDNRRSILGILVPEVEARWGMPVISSSIFVDAFSECFGRCSLLDPGLVLHQGCVHQSINRVHTRSSSVW